MYELIERRLLFRNVDCEASSRIGFSCHQPLYMSVGLSAIFLYNIDMSNTYVSTVLNLLGWMKHATYILATDFTLQVSGQLHCIYFCLDVIS